MNVGTNAAVATANNNYDNGTSDGSGKSETMLAAVGIGKYKPSYDSYAFFQTAAIARNTANRNKPCKTYPRASQGHGPPTPPPDLAGRSAD